MVAPHPGLRPLAHPARAGSIRRPRRAGDAWHDCRLVLRLYDVSYIQFNGLQRPPHPGPPAARHCAGRCSSTCRGPAPGSSAEVGFLLRNGEFIPAARSPVVPFAADAPSPRTAATRRCSWTAAGAVEEVGNVWDQERDPARAPPAAACASRCASRPSPSRSRPPASTARWPTFVAELAAGQCAHGHEVHVFVPRQRALPADREDGRRALPPPRRRPDGSPLEQARSLRPRRPTAASRELPPFDLIHLHEWMTGLGPWLGDRPTVLSLSSVEATRRNGGRADDAFAADRGGRARGGPQRPAAC